MRKSVDRLIREHPDVADQSFEAGQRESLWQTQAAELARNDTTMVRNRDKTDRHTARDIKESAERGNAATIWEFVKTGNSQPYIPGSSVKGAVRTAIAYGLLKNSQPTFSRVKGAIVGRDASGRATAGDKDAVERFIFNDDGDAHDDLMRLWSFGDSAPLDCHGTLSVVAGKRLSSTEPSGYANWHEAMTETSGTLVLSASFDSVLAASGFWSRERLMRFPQSMTDVCSCLNQFAGDIIAHELSYFRNHPVKPQEVVTFYEGLQERRSRGEVLLCLGKGTGWLKKTIGLLLRNDRSTTFRDVVAVYNLGRGQRRFTDFPTSREMVVRNRKPAVFGWAQMTVLPRKEA